LSENVELAADTALATIDIMFILLVEITLLGHCTGCNFKNRNDQLIRIMLILLIIVLDQIY
jgi:hypothetical protein